jgi:lipopolysaccharide export system protein LptC
MTMDDAASHHRARRAAEMRQYSRSVRWMKVALPIAAIGLIFMIFLMGKDRGAVIDLGDARNAAVLGAGLKLENPRFAGTTDDGDPFVVTARSALPDGAMPDLIDLDAPTGEIRLNGGVRVTVEAKDGRMFRKDERLHLMGDVTMVTSNGYVARTERVEMDLSTKTAVAPGAVAAEGPRGSIRADRLQVNRATPESRDVTIRFEGNVRLVYRAGE